MPPKVLDRAKSTVLKIIIIGTFIELMSFSTEMLDFPKGPLTLCDESMSCNEHKFDHF